MEQSSTPGRVSSDAGLGHDVERLAFEAYFTASRRSRGPSKRPTFDLLGDGTYAEDHTQRHWWTWQTAVAEVRSRFADVAAPERFVYSDDEWRVRCDVRDAILGA